MFRSGSSRGLTLIGASESLRRQGKISTGQNGCQHINCIATSKNDSVNAKLPPMPCKIHFILATVGIACAPRKAAYSTFAVLAMHQIRRPQCLKPSTYIDSRRIIWQPKSHD